MPEDVNPFEPWRPRPEPGSPQREVRPQPPAEPEWYRQPAMPEMLWPSEKPAGRPRTLFTVGSVLLLFVAMIALGVQGGTHITRIVSAVLILWLGLLFGLIVGRQWRWYWRVGCFVVALAGPAACWYLVPTTGGVSLLEAQRRLDSIEKLPPGDVAAYRAGSAGRTELSQQFPSWKSKVVLAERSWMRRTVMEEAGAARRMQAADPDDALQRFKQMQASLQKLEHFGAVSSEFFQAKRESVQACLAAAEKGFDRLLLEKKFALFNRRINEASAKYRADAAEVALTPDLDSRLRPWHERRVRAEADQAAGVLRKLLDRQEYEKVAAEGKPLFDRLLRNPWGQDEYVCKVILPIRDKALTARLDRANEELTRLHEQGRFEQVARRAQEVTKELSVESEALGRGKKVQTRFAGVRLLALTARVKSAQKTLDDLFDKKDYPAVAARGRQLQGELAPEAAQLGGGELLRTTLTEVRRKALAARLEQMRKEALDLLARDQYQAVGAVGEKSVKELGAEADDVGGRAEVNRFRDSCKVFADLAKKANVEDKK